MRRSAGKATDMGRLRRWPVAILGLIAMNAAVALESATLADDRVEASYNGGSEFVHDAQLDRLLARLADRIQAANTEARCVSLRIHALDQPLPYSFVLNNGAFYVSTGLIARLQSDGELAAIIAMPLAALCRNDAQKLQLDQRKRFTENFVPNLLLITLTAGLGGSSIAKSNERHTTEDRLRLRDASDVIAVHWLTTAGYDATVAQLAMAHLSEALTAESRSGVPEFSNPAELDTRRAALATAVQQAESGIGAAPPSPPDAKDPFRQLARRFALSLAREDLASHTSGLTGWLDHIDALDGPSGYTAYLRAELARNNSGSDANLPIAIAAYEKSVTFSDTPAAAYRELGFLYRRSGDAARAHENFSKYLQKAPSAVDAPIIRGYLESP